MRLIGASLPQNESSQGVAAWLKKSAGALIGWEETEHAGDFGASCKMETDES